MPDVFNVPPTEFWSKTVWLVVGKGPSFSAWKQRPDLPRIALNHTILNLPCAKITHCVDLEVLPDCAAEIQQKSESLLMPWFPNRNFRREHRSLLELGGEFPLLSEMNRQNRLLWYHRTGSAGKSSTDTLGIPIRFFSIEGAVGVLAHAGVRQIFTAGIDGGTDYAAEFRHHTPLENGRASFDDQFRELNRIQNEFALDLQRLRVTPAAAPFSLPEGT